MRGRSRPAAGGGRLVILTGAALAVLPFLWMLSTSLKTSAEVETAPPTVLPAQPQFSNYPDAVRRAGSIGTPFLRCFLNSALVAAAVTAAVLVTSALAGFAFSHLRFPGRGIILLAFLATMMIPFEVTLLPNFVLIHRLGWYDTYAALIVPWTANAFSIFFVTRILERLPREMYEAARLDGCGDLRFLWSVGLPMIRPALVTIGLYTFIGSWNAFLWPLIATSRPELSVVQKGLAAFMQEAGTHYHLLMAAAALTILPVIVIYVAAQRWFQQGAEYMTA